MAASLALAAVALMAALAGAAQADDPGPPFRDRVEGRMLYDVAGVFSSEARRATNSALVELANAGRIELFVYTQIKPGADTVEAAQEDARALLTQWGADGTDRVAAALVWEFDRNVGRAVIGAAASAGLADRGLDGTAIQALVDGSVAEDLSAGRWLSALTKATVAVSIAVPGTGVTPTPAPGSSPEPGSTTPPGPRPGSGPAPPAGPPYPEPVEGQVVYDFADAFTPTTEEAATRTIVAIEQRTGAEVVVYSQVKPESDTPAEAEADAIALIDEWGIGRQGFDDGLAILFDLDETGCHGQVQLYGAPGYRAAYLSNEDRQRIFDQAMLPRLRTCDLDGALLVALNEIDAAAVPERARSLETGRQVNAVLGLVGAPALFLLLVAWAGSTWWRYGKDPVYLDDPSILMPAPPPELTPAAGALLVSGRSTRRALTTAMLDLAARGEIAFRRHDQLLRDKVGVQVLEPDEGDPHIARYRRHAIGRAETYALERLRGIAASQPDGYLEPDDLLEFGKSVDTFDARLEDHVAERGWLREAPRRAIERWSTRAAICFIGGFVIAVVAWNLPSSGLLLIGVALVVAAVVMAVLARVMPARTMAGAMLFAMLAAYKRTLHKTMEQARSMDQVVRDAGLPWLETPDQAAVWGVALGLEDDVQEVLARSLEDVRAGTTAPSAVWTPVWYADQGSGRSATTAGVGAGLLSASAIPDFGGMMSAIGTIGDAPSSSGSGSGGFSGGSSGGGGGGAGGGF